MSKTRLDLSRTSFETMREQYQNGSSRKARVARRQNKRAQELEKARVELSRVVTMTKECKLIPKRTFVGVVIGVAEMYYVNILPKDEDGNVYVVPSHMTWPWPRPEQAKEEAQVIAKKLGWEITDWA